MLTNPEMDEVCQEDGDCDINVNIKICIKGILLLRALKVYIYCSTNKLTINL